jgi:hypothetical protein
MRCHDSIVTSFYISFLQVAGFGETLDVLFCE